MILCCLRSDFRSTCWMVVSSQPLCVLLAVSYLFIWWYCHWSEYACRVPFSSVTYSVPWLAMTCAFWCTISSLYLTVYSVGLWLSAILTTNMMTTIITLMMAKPDMTAET